MFPQEYGCEGIPDDLPTEFGYFGFLCFEDDSFSLYNPTSNSCTKVVGLPENTQLSQVACYPNPASTSLDVTASQEIDLVTVYSYTGESVMLVDADDYAVRMDVSTLSSGIYFFEIRLQNGGVEKVKVVLN